MFEGRFRPLMTAAIFVLSSQVATYAAIDGEPQLLQQIVDLRRENLDRLVTWSGNASIKIYIRDIGNVDDRRQANASFILDATQDKLKWTWSYTEISRKQDGQELPTANFLDEWKDIVRIKTSDMVVKYEPLIKRKGSYKPALVIYPGSASEGETAGFAEGFDPRWYFTRYGLNLNEYLAVVLRNKDKWKSQTVVKAVGHIVSVDLPGSGKDPNHLEFDIQRGGNLTLDVSHPGDEIARAEYDYAEFNGVWVPVLFRYTKEVGASHTVNLSRVVTFEKTVVNRPVDPAEFTIESLSPPLGTSVSDHRLGLSYPYGLKVSDHDLQALMESATQPKNDESSNHDQIPITTRPLQTLGSKQGTSRTWVFIGICTGLAGIVAWIALRFLRVNSIFRKS